MREHFPANTFPSKALKRICSKVAFMNIYPKASVYKDKKTVRILLWLPFSIPIQSIDRIPITE